MATKKQITTRTTAQNMTKSYKKFFASKTELGAVQTLAASALHSVGFTDNTINFYTSTDKSGSAAFSVNLPVDMVLDQDKTKMVDNFSWSAATYPGSTDPELNGKPVLVMAVKGNGENPTYSFLNMEKLIDIYTAKAGDGTATVTIDGYEISVNVNISTESDNILKKDSSGKLYVPKPEVPDVTGKADKDEDAVEGNFAAFDDDGNPVDSGKKPSDFVAADPEDDVLRASDIDDYSENDIDALLAAED